MRSPAHCKLESSHDRDDDKLLVDGDDDGDDDPRDAEHAYTNHRHA